MQHIKTNRDLEIKSRNASNLASQVTFESKKAPNPPRMLAREAQKLIKSHKKMSSNERRMESILNKIEKMLKTKNKEMKKVEGKRNSN